MARSIVEALTDALGPDKVRTDETERTARRHDYWVVSHLRDHLGRASPSPACLVRPASVDDVRVVLALASAAGAPVVPFGLGSGVVGGVVASPDSILLDMGSMSRTRTIDEVNLLASFDAGKNGLEAEQEAAAQS